jgi:hypothetical protein
MLVVTPRRPVKVRAESLQGPRRRDIREVGERLAEPISTWWALGGVAAVVGAVQAVMVLEPTPVNPDLPTPWYVTVPNVIVLYGIFVAIAGLLVRQRWGMAVSLLSAGIGLALVIACPVSGHHHFGLWWVGELAAFSAWTGVSLAGLRSRAAMRA